MKERGVISVVSGRGGGDDRRKLEGEAGRGRLRDLTHPTTAGGDRSGGKGESLHAGCRLPNPCQWASCGRLATASLETGTGTSKTRSQSPFATALGDFLSRHLEDSEPVPVCNCVGDFLSRHLEDSEPVAVSNCAERIRGRTRGSRDSGMGAAGVRRGRTSAPVGRGKAGLAHFLAASYRVLTASQLMVFHQAET